MDLVARALLTYLVHSTVLLGAALLARVVLREHRLALQEALLRAALAGAFLTTALQVGLELHPLAGAWPLPGQAAAGPAEPGRSFAAAPVASMATAEAALPVPARWETRIVLAPSPFERALSALRRSVGEPLARWWADRRWRTPLAIGWAALAGLGLARLAVAAVRLRRLLRDRRPIEDGPLAPEAASVAGALGLPSPVRLSAAPRLTVPLATGVLRPEVCLPTRAVDELAPDEQVALCAHEIAHVARRDPAWILLARLVEAAAPVQPLNGWARRRLQDLAECLSDDLAVSVSAQPAGLARSLVDVAAWTLGDRPFPPAAAAGALSARSRLGHRVERLMNPLRTLERPRRFLLPAAGLAVLATAFVTPGVSGSPAADDSKPAPVLAAAPRPEPLPAAVPEPAPLPEAMPDPAEAQQPAPPAPPARPVPARAPAAPSPAAGPEPPSPPEAPGTTGDLEQQLDALTRRIEERVRAHDGEMERLNVEMEAIAERMKPNEAEMERLSSEMAKAAAEMSAAIAEGVGKEAGERSRERSAAAARRMAELREQIHATTRQMHTEEMHALAEKARAMAERARPTDEERRELQRLSRELAQAGRSDSRQFANATRESMEQVRRQLQEAMEQMRAALREAAEAMRAAGEATRHSSGEQPKQRE